MKEIAKLITDSKNPLGYLAPADYDRTVAVLLGAKSDPPVITKKPEGAMTAAVYEASKKYWDPAKGTD